MCWLLQLRGISTNLHLSRCDYAIVEAWLSIHDVTTVQNGALDCWKNAALELATDPQLLTE